MAMTKLPQDFKDFLKLLTTHKVEYLLIGGYAVSYHGYPRATADMDIWIAINKTNANKMVTVLKEFGFDVPQLSTDLFFNPKKVIRMGMPPFRIEVLTELDGVEFDKCFREKIIDEIDGIQINIINLNDLKINKKASGRFKDLNDLEYLP